MLAVVFFANLLFLYMALVFESVYEMSRNREVHQKMWYICIFLLSVVECTALQLAKLKTHIYLTMCIIVIIVAVLWLRATVLMARALLKMGEGGAHDSSSVVLMEKAQATKRLIIVTARLLVLFVLCYVEIVLAALTVLSPAPLVFVTWTVEWIQYLCFVILIDRLGDYLGVPIRRAAGRVHRRTSAKVAASVQRASSRPDLSAVRNTPEPSSTGSLEPKCERESEAPTSNKSNYK
jgi:hypothetical protein